jgi:hypothetical protein
MVFYQKLKTMVQVVMSFIDSVVAIAAGQIEGAAKMVENALVKVLSLAISFLAGFLGLGGIAGKVMAVIEKIRGTVDKGIDALIAWIVKMAKALFAKVFGTKKDDKAEGEEGNIAIAQEVGAKLVDMSVPEDAPDKADAAVKAEAAKLATQYKPKLQPGTKLTVDFTTPADKKGDEIDFTVVIAPNTTRVKFVKGQKGFLPAEAGTYSELKSKEGRKNKDGSIQEAHHAPPVEFANSLGDALAEAGKDIMNDHPYEASILMMAGSSCIAEVTGHGADLSAILVHENTHRTHGGAGPRIHGSEIRKDLEKYFTKAEKKDVVETARGDIAVKPGQAGYGRKIKDVATRVSGSGDASDAMRTHGPEIVERLYDKEERRSLGAVEIALSKSTVDGTAEQRRSAISKLKTVAKTKWSGLLKLVNFS